MREAMPDVPEDAVLLLHWPLAGRALAARQERSDPPQTPPQMHDMATLRLTVTCAWLPTILTGAPHGDSQLYRPCLFQIGQGNAAASRHARSQCGAGARAAQRRGDGRAQRLSGGAHLDPAVHRREIRLALRATSWRAEGLRAYA